MEITFNNLTTSNSLICFSDVPNILTFTGSSTEDSYAEYEFFYTTIINVEVNTTYSINFGEYSITSTFDPSNVGGTVFYLPQFNSYNEMLYSCHTIVKAFRNVPFIAANYDVWLDDGGDGTVSQNVCIRAKKKGKNFNVEVSTDLPASIYNWQRRTNGNTNDAMLQGRSNKIMCDIYKYRIPSALDANNQTAREYVTSLEKNYYGSPVSFNVTPVLNTLLGDSYDDIQEFQISMYGFSDKELVFGEQTSNMYITNGYLCNFSQPFIRPSSTMLAANVQRGDSRPYYNNTYLYTYYPSIDFSLYKYPSFSLETVNVNYVDSTGENTLYSESYPVSSTENNILDTYNVQLEDDKLQKAYFIDLIIPYIGAIRYNVIKPINAANNTEARRVWWYNEYNGVSFFDFTGERTETRKENIEYYDKQEFAFYDGDREKKMCYDKNIDISVQHTTHYIDKNGTYMLYSLQNSRKAWVNLDGRKYFITITNLEISQTANTNHIYSARITYEYSRADLC